MPRAFLTLLLLLASLAPAWAQPADEPPPPPARSFWNFELPEILSPPAPEELFESDYGHNIRIVGTKEYIAEMTAVLDRLATLPAGRELLLALGESGYPTELRAIPLLETVLSGPNARPLDKEASNYRVGPGGELIPGPGSGAEIHMNPGSVIPETNPEIVLAHELIHALHYHRGERLVADQEEGPNAGTGLEELRTIGTDGYEDAEHTENELRGEWNELYPDEPVAPIRTSHGADFDYEHEGYVDPEGPSPEPGPEPDRAPHAGAVEALEALSGPR